MNRVRWISISFATLGLVALMPLQAKAQYNPGNSGVYNGQPTQTQPGDYNRHSIQEQNRDGNNRQLNQAPSGDYNRQLNQAPNRDDNRQLNQETQRDYNRQSDRHKYTVYYHRRSQRQWQTAGSYQNREEANRELRLLQRQGYVVRIEQR